MAKGRNFALVVFAALALIWSYNWIAMKAATEFTGPFTFAGVRSAIGVVALFAALVATGRSLRPVGLGETLLLGLLQTTAFTGLSQAALMVGGAGKVSVLAYTMPFWTVLLAWLLLGERLKPLQWLAIGLAAAGLVLILQPWDLQASLLSQSLAVAAGLSWAASIIVAKRLRARHQVDLLSLTAWQLALGTIPLLALAWLFGEPAIRWTPELGAIFAFSGIFSTAVGWLMWLYLLNRLSAGTVSLNSLIIPVLAVLFAWLQFGEQPDGFELAGMLVITAALGLMSAVAARHARRVEAALSSG